MARRQRTRVDAETVAVRSRRPAHKAHGQFMAAFIIWRSADGVFGFGEIHDGNFGNVDMDNATSCEGRLILPQLHTVFACDNSEALAERRRRSQGNLRVPVNVGGEEPTNITTVG
jgi:hypothetical protein